MKNNQLNDLFDYGYKIYQNDDFFKFSIDSVLLAEFVDLKKGKKNILDLCSGNAPIPMILSKKYGEKVEITGIELQKEIFTLGEKSIEYNEITNINFINGDIKDISKIFKNKKFSVITCNPPYFKVVDDSNINENKIKAFARHELGISLEEVISLSSKVIENQGYLYLVHRPERIADIIYLLNKYNYGVKRIQAVYNDHQSKSCLILVEAVFNGKNYVIINSPLFLKDHLSYKNIFRK